MLKTKLQIILNDGLDASKEIEYISKVADHAVIVHFNASSRTLIVFESGLLVAEFTQVTAYIKTTTEEDVESLRERSNLMQKPAEF